MKKILIMNTGGTLSSVMHKNGMAPGLKTEDLAEQLHIVSSGVDLELQDVMALDSANVFPEDWAMLAQKISDVWQDYDGIVIIHGTDTLAYTSSMLSFMLQNISIPVVVTGSQLSMADSVTDAMENCRCAIHMAASEVPGVYVAFNRKVMRGCRASKVRSLSFDAFDSINAPYAATISSLGMRINEKSIRYPHGKFHLLNHYSDRVFLLKMFPGIEPDTLRLLKDQGYKGIYIEAFGMGGMPFIKHDFIKAAKEVVDSGVTVLVGTQVRYEGANLSVYETGMKALEAGVISAHDMTSEASVTKLMWVLGQTDDPQEIKDYFKKDICGEINLNDVYAGK